MNEGMNMNQAPYQGANQGFNQNPYPNQGQNMNPYPNQGQNVNPYGQPVTFNNPMQRAPKKPMDKSSLIGWIVRGAVILTELFFFLPLCLISCSYYDEKKYLNGFSASFGFKFYDQKVDGLWWLFLVFLITAVVIAMWFLKDLKVIKDFSLKQPILCLLTSGAELVNFILLVSFMGKAKELAEAGSCEIRFTFFFIVILILDILLCLGSAASLVILIIKTPNFFDNIGAEFKKLSAPKQNNNMQMAGQYAAQAQPQAQPQVQPQVQPQAQPQQEFKFCTQCGARLPKESAFCTQCGNKF